MTWSEKEAALIGSLVIERISLEEKLCKLRDEASLRAREWARIARLLVINPEGVFPQGRNIDPQFAGESAIDGKSVDVDSLTEEIRATIVLRKKVVDRLAQMGLDPAKFEDEKNLRASRALWHPATCPPAGENGNLPPKQVGFGAKRSRARA